jgi:hypothetical protein
LPPPKKKIPHSFFAHRASRSKEGKKRQAAAAYVPGPSELLFALNMLGGSYGFAAVFRFADVPCMILLSQM